MSERDEFYYQNKQILECQIEKISELKIHKQNQLRKELEFQDSLLYFFENIRERDPETFNIV